MFRRRQPMSLPRKRFAAKAELLPGNCLPSKISCLVKDLPGGLCGLASIPGEPISMQRRLVAMQANGVGLSVRSTALRWNALHFPT